MTDAGRDINDVRDEDRLPWLEAVEDEESTGDPSALKLIVGVIVALLAIGLVVGGIFWLKNKEAASPADAGLIAAPSSPYKVKPAEAGGMKVEGAGDTAYAASEGADQNSAIDLSAMPETALTPGRGDAAAPASPAASAPAAAPAPAPTAVAGHAAREQAPAPAKPAATPAASKAVAPKPAPPKPSAIAKVPAVATRAAPIAPPQKALAPATAPQPSAPAAGGGTVQLGAFSSEAKANAAWKSLSKRFGFLSGLTPAVTPVAVNGSTLYRLRAPAGGDAGSICAKLKVAGETCAVIG